MTVSLLTAIEEAAGKMNLPPKEASHEEAHVGVGVRGDRCSGLRRVVARGLPQRRLRRAEPGRLRAAGRSDHRHAHRRRGRARRAPDRGRPGRSGRRDGRDQRPVQPHRPGLSAWRPPGRAARERDPAHARRAEHQLPDEPVAADVLRRRIRARYGRAQGGARGVDHRLRQLGFPVQRDGRHRDLRALRP